MELSTIQQYVEGQRYGKDERAFRYAHAGNALTQHYAAYCNMPTLEHANITVNAPVGTRVLHCVAVGAVLANQFKGGYAVLSWPGGVHRIRSNTAAAPLGAFTVTLEDVTTLPFTAAGTDCTLYTNEYHDVRSALFDGTVQGDVTFVGMPLMAVPAGNWCWLQTWGPCLGMGVANFGAIESQRAAYFWRDGAVVNQSGQAWAIGQCLQYAGDVLPFTGPVAHDITNAMIFMNLKLKP